jgi:1-acyl-sn-glycerol-3-phosphate acyltransferase
MAAEFARRDRFALVIPPEATRARAPHWKSGFYRVARAAHVPIACGYLDYARKRGGIGPVFVPSGDLQADMDRIADFYAGVTAKYPEQFGPVRLEG